LNFVHFEGFTGSSERGFDSIYQKFSLKRQNCPSPTITHFCLDEAGDGTEVIVKYVSPEWGDTGIRS
jgi:hypothetical protein